MMKLITIISIALAVVLLPFRRRITREAILRIVRDPATITRLTYAGIAMLWLYVADDAARIHNPPQLYMAVPFAVLLLYAVFPVRWVWLLVVITLFTGWSLQMNQTMHFQVAHLGLKTDKQYPSVTAAVPLYSQPLAENNDDKRHTNGYDN